MTSSPGPILRATQSQNQGIGAGVAANALGNADVVGELSFKTLHGRAAYVSRQRQALFAPLRLSRRQSARIGGLSRGGEHYSLFTPQISSIIKANSCSKTVSQKRLFKYLIFGQANNHVIERVDRC